MPLDPSIILQGRAPQLPNAKDLLTLKQLGMANDEAALSLDDARRTAAGKRTLADLYRQNTDLTGAVNTGAISSGLAQAGYGDQIPAVQAQAQATQAGDLKNQASQLALHKQKLDLVNNAFTSLLSDPNITHDKVISRISQLVDQGIISNDQGAQMVRTLPGPDQLRSFLVSKAMETMDASKQLEAMLPKTSNIDTGGEVNLGTVNPLTGQRTSTGTLAKTATPGEKLTYDWRKNQPGKVAFTDEEGSLMAALAERGISLPTGLRSREQMKATFASLISRNPDLSPDDIAEKIATGQININAERKETMTAASQAGRVAVAVNELQTFGDQVLEASRAIPRGKFIPVNKLIQMTDQQLSDPSLINLKVKMQALNNAYDQLAARGGTDAEKRAHIAQLFNTATSPEGVEALIKAVKDESHAAEEAARKATQRRPHETEQAPGPGTGANVTDSGASVSNW